MWSSNNEGAGNNIRYNDAAGNSLNVDWHIADLMLLEASELGEGFHVQDPRLVEYVDNFVEQLKVGCGLSRSSWKLISGNVLPGHFEYPQGTDFWYIGVMVELDIAEVR